MQSRVRFIFVHDSSDGAPTRWRIRPIRSTLVEATKGHPKHPGLQGLRASTVTRRGLDDVLSEEGRESED